MLIYLLPSLLVAGFFYMIFRNSPGLAYTWLFILVVCVGISFIQPRETYVLVAVGLAIISLFVVAVKSRNVRFTAVNKWFSDNGFQRIEFSSVESLFSSASTGTVRYYPYKGEFVDGGNKIPFLMAVRYSSSTSGNTVSIILDCSYYFNGKIGTDVLDQKFQLAKKNTPHTNLWKSQLRFFDLKDCEIFQPAIGGIVVSWRVPDTVEGYGERYEWIKNALRN